jgi:hypothetical protein
MNFSNEIKDEFLATWKLGFEREDAMVWKGCYPNQLRTGSWSEHLGEFVSSRTWYGTTFSLTRRISRKFLAQLHEQGLSSFTREPHGAKGKGLSMFT